MRTKLTKSRSVNKGLIIILLSMMCSFLVAQNTPQIKGRQYVFDRFYQSEVLKKSGARLSAILNYNCITEEMIFVQDNMRLALDNLNAVDTVFIDGRKFVPFDNKFYEVVLDSDIDLFIQHRTDAQLGGENVGYGGTSKLSNVKTVNSVSQSGQYFYMDMPTNIILRPNSSFWVRRNGEMFRVYNRKTTIKALPELSGQVKSYIKQNKVDFDNADDVIRMMKFLLNQ